MLEGPVTLACIGAVLCGATAFGVIRARRHRSSRKGLEELLEPPPLAEARETPLDRVAREITLVLAAENHDRPTPDDPSPPRGTWLAGEESQVTRDVRTGLLLLSRAIPDVGLHDSNLVLLAKLRAALGAPGFYLVCCRLAALLNAHDPTYQDLARQLARGQLPWGAFLVAVRDLQVPPHAPHALPV